MRCEQCGGPMKVRFNQLHCEVCEERRALAQHSECCIGFVVVDLHALRLRTKRPVFRTHEMARRWITIRGIPDADIHAVLLPNSVEWICPGGQMTGMELASRSYRVEVNLAAIDRPRRSVG